MRGNKGAFHSIKQQARRSTLSCLGETLQLVFLLLINQKLGFISIATKLWGWGGKRTLKMDNQISKNKQNLMVLPRARNQLSLVVFCNLKNKKIYYYIKQWCNFNFINYKIWERERCHECLFFPNKIPSYFIKLAPISFF